MKTIRWLVIVCLMLTSVQLVAQAPGKGSKIFNLGFGIGATLYNGKYWDNLLPPISVSGEYIIEDKVLDKGSIGVGGYLGFARYKYAEKWQGYEWGWNYSNVIFGPRGIFHYPLDEHFDTYAGVLMGYNLVFTREFGDFHGANTAKGNSLLWSWYVGGRYQVSPDLGVMMELGYGIAWLNVGLSLKM